MIPGQFEDAEEPDLEEVLSGFIIFSKNQIS